MYSKYLDTRSKSCFTVLMAQTLNLRDEVYDLVRVTREPVNSTYSVQMPSTREVQKLWNRFNIRAPVPDNDDQFWKEIEARVWSNMPKLRELADRLSPRVPGTASTPRVQELAAPSTPAGDEATVRSMKGSAARELCDALSLQVPPHPTNPGITAMRCKNALLVHIRRGGSLGQPVAQIPVRKPRPKFTVT